MSTTTTASAAAQLTGQGYCRFDLREELHDPGLGAGLARLQAALDDLPADPYARSRHRFRRYSPAILTPWSRRIDWTPALEGAGGLYTEYCQQDHNVEFPGVHRRFSPLPEALTSDPWLHRVIWYDFDLTFWSPTQRTRPMVAGVHLVKLAVAAADQRAVSSPDCLHQDGEPFTFVHLVARDNATGASNVIASPHCAGSQPEDVAEDFIADRFELREPLESYGVHDRAVSHYVSPLRRGPEERPALRAALLIDFTPLVPAL
jgi:hypothetical protein